MTNSNDYRNKDDNENAEANKSSEPTNKTRTLRPGFSYREDGTMLYKGIPVHQLLAWPIPFFGDMICRSRQTVWKEITLGRIRIKNRLISRAAAEEYLNGAQPTGKAIEESVKR